MDNKKLQMVLIVIGIIAIIALVSMIIHGPVQQAQDKKEFRKALVEWGKLPREERIRRMGGGDAAPVQPVQPTQPVQPNTP